MTLPTQITTYKYGGVLGMKALSVNKLSAAFYISDVKTHFKKAASRNTRPNSHTGERGASRSCTCNCHQLLVAVNNTALFYADELARAVSRKRLSMAKGYIAAYAG